MAFFGLIKDKEETPTVTAETPVVKKAKPAVPFASVIPTTPQFVTTAQSSAVLPTNGNALFAAAIAPDAEYVNDLQTKAANTKNQAYATFQKARAALATLPEQQQYTTALAVIAATANTDAKAVLASLDESLAIITSEGQAFDAAATAQHDNEVTKRQTEAAQLVNRLSAMQKEMQALSEQIATLSSEATTAQTNIERERAIYTASMNAVQSALTTERQKIASLIPPQG